MLKRSAVIFMPLSLVLLSRRMTTAPTRGRKMRLLSIGNPNACEIVCSIIYLRSIIATNIRMPIAMIVA